MVDEGACVKGYLAMGLPRSHDHQQSLRFRCKDRYAAAAVALSMQQAFRMPLRVGCVSSCFGGDDTAERARHIRDCLA